MKQKIDSKLALNTIDLRNFNTWDRDLLPILKLKGKVSDIEQVLLWNNRLTCNGMETLSLCKWDCLTLLDVDLNQIGNKGMKYISRLQSPQLRELNLCTNLIGKEGVNHLVKGKWPKLETFFLNGNKIGEESIKFINKNSWKKVKNLHIYNTQLVFKEAKGLVLCNWSLQSLDIGNNIMSNAQYQQLKSLLKKKMMLKSYRY